jgi:hypothetical protein
VGRLKYHRERERERERKRGREREKEPRIVPDYRRLINIRDYCCY